jgi:hypothetical protein
VLAIDAEFVQVRERGPEDPPHRLALLQLAAAPGSQEVFVIDALRIGDLAPLEAPLGDGSVLKLFHGMGADVRVLATRGLVARHTLDLEAVSRSIFGQHESSLQAMLLRACGVRLDKSLQRSDWAQRPLAPARLAYAAHDAEMTLLLYTWLATNFPWAIALHETAADASAPAVATWLLPFLEGARATRMEWGPAEVRVSAGTSNQTDDLRAALANVRRPTHRARLIRLIADLEVVGLAPDLHPLLAALAAEERAAAVRALGRLHDQSAAPALRGLLDDAVYDVRQTARTALGALTRGAGTSLAATREWPGRQAGWKVGGSEAHEEAEWQATLRARFGDSDTGVGIAQGSSEVSPSDPAATESAPTPTSEPTNRER